MTIHLFGFLICPTLDEADRVSHLLPDHLRRSRAEPGCLTFEVFRSHEDPTRFAVNEVFRDRAAFEAHQARAAASTWGKATRHLQRAYQVDERP